MVYSLTLFSIVGLALTPAWNLPPDHICTLILLPKQSNSRETLTMACWRDVDYLIPYADSYDTMH